MLPSRQNIVERYVSLISAVSFDAVFARTAFEEVAEMRLLRGVIAVVCGGRRLGRLANSHSTHPDWYFHPTHPMPRLDPGSYRLDLAVR